MPKTLLNGSLKFKWLRDGGWCAALDRRWGMVISMIYS